HQQQMQLQRALACRNGAEAATQEAGENHAADLEGVELQRLAQMEETLHVGVDGVEHFAPVAAEVLLDGGGVESENLQQLPQLLRNQLHRMLHQILHRHAGIFLGKTLHHL